MSDSPAPEPGAAALADELRDALLARLAARLRDGQVLLAEAQFQQAVAEDYLAATGREPSPELAVQFLGSLREINQDRPEVFVIPGLENWLIQTFQGTVSRQGWGVTELQEQGPQALRDLLRQEKVRSLLAQFHVSSTQLNIRRCLRAIANQVAGREASGPKRGGRLAQVLSPARADAAEEALPPGIQQWLGAPASEPTAAEIEQRSAEQEALRTQLRGEQLAHLRQNLDVYVQQGKLTAEEADKLRQLEQVDRALDQGRVEREKGERIRNSILTGKVRFALEKKVRQATDYAVSYLQVFEALRRIAPKYDDALRFLVRHKEAVNAEAKEPALFEPMCLSLAGDVECLRLLIAAMDRQDAEVRMISAHLPPYNYVVKRDQERVERLVIEADFVDQLRRLSREEMAQRLNAPERAVRVRPAADMVCLYVLVSRLVKPTPFRKEIRWLKLNLVVEEFYRATENLEEARGKAQTFVRGRLRSLFPDLTPEETEEIRQRSDELIAAVEEKVAAQRRQERGEAPAEAPADSGAPAAEGDLTAEEVTRGVQFGRVLVRIAGAEHLVPYKIMPDPEDASRFLLVRRDPQTGELTPLLRRGLKRYVEKNRDGTWELS